MNSWERSSKSARTSRIFIPANGFPKGTRRLRPMPQLHGGLRHLCANTSGVGVNRPGCFAEFIALPMTNVSHHERGMDRDVAAIFDPFGNAVHTALTLDVLGEDVLIIQRNALCRASYIYRRDRFCLLT